MHCAHQRINFGMWYAKKTNLSVQIGHSIIKATPSLCLFGDLTNISSDKVKSSMLITSLSTAKKLIRMN